MSDNQSTAAQHAEAESQTTTVKLPELSSDQKCKLELMALRQDKRFMHNAVFGRQLSAEEIAENKRRDTAYREAAAIVIKKYGMEEEYLQIRRDEISRLEKRIAEEQAWIDAIESA